MKKSPASSYFKADEESEFHVHTLQKWTNQWDYVLFCQRTLQDRTRAVREETRKKGEGFTQASPLQLHMVWALAAPVPPALFIGLEMGSH
jgi:hypothetical protein